MPDHPTTPRSGNFVSARVAPAVNRFFMRRLRQSVLIKSFIYRLVWLLPETFRDQGVIRCALKSLARQGGPVCFLNIGANDGLAGDPLREFIIRYQWRGVLVEPVDYVFARLVRAYRGVRQVTFENAALAEITGARQFWFLRKTESLPPGYDQIGSFQKEHVLKHAGMFPGLEEFVVSREIPCITLADLLRKHAVSRVDLVLIDTEGYDYEVIKQLDLRQQPPGMIIFESGHLPPGDQQACFALLRAHGYTLTEEDGNAVAVLAAVPAT